MFEKSIRERELDDKYSKIIFDRWTNHGGFIRESILWFTLCTPIISMLGFIQGLCFGYNKE